MKGIACTVVGLSLVGVMGCGGSDNSTFGEKAPQPGFGAPSGPQGDLGNNNPAAPPPDSCSEAAKLVYVISEQNDFYSFAPDLLRFKKIGKMSCPTAAPTLRPVSMSVDRSATAWVNYEDGKLYKVSTTDASCTATTFASNQLGFLKFGMAFATKDANSTAETLFISGAASQANQGKGFGTIDLNTMKMTMIAQPPANLNVSADLTGTGDGRLYGFFATNPMTLAQIDALKGSTSAEQPLNGVSTNVNGFAFSFWGGDFW